MEPTSYRVQRRLALWSLSLCTLVLMPFGVFAECPADLAGRQPALLFHIEAEDLPKVVHDLTTQAGYAFIMVHKNSDPVPTSPVSLNGEMTLCEALRRVLTNTGYEFTVAQGNRRPRIVVHWVGRPPAPRQISSTSMGPPALVRVSNVYAREQPTEEVLVTGSYLRNAGDVIAPVVQVSGPELTQGSFATVQDALYQQLPFNSLSGPREDLLVNGNLGSGAGVNLRSLGVGATLVLVDGIRQPTSGTMGDFTDISQVPMSVVDHIEILPDGASALYGSDAIAGVVNVITKQNFQGFETQARFGGAPGGRRESFFSQLAGTKWEGGHLMMTYQFTDATSLAAATRGYAADADKQPYGGGDYRVAFGDPGNILDPNTLLPAYGIPSLPSGQRVTPSSLSRTINLENQFAGYDLFPDRRTQSIYLAGAQRVTDAVELTFEARYNDRTTFEQNFPNTFMIVVPKTNPYFVDPFGGSSAVLVNYDFSNAIGPDIFSTKTKSYSESATLLVHLPVQWEVRVNESFGRESLAAISTDVNMGAVTQELADPNTAAAFDPFGNNTNLTTLQGFHLLGHTAAISSVTTVTAVANGPVISLPAGSAQLAVGAEHRRETFSRQATSRDPSDIPDFVGHYTRNVDAAFGELSIPLIGQDEKRLKLVLSGRKEHYDDFGSSTNGQARLAWTPVSQVKLRASWGTSFRAPTLDDLHDTSENASAISTLPDPKSPAGYSVVGVLEGTNSSLRAETATTWTSGMDWTPSFVPGFTGSLTYYSIDYKGQIAQPALGNFQDILENESEWAGVITRNPARAEVLALCNRPDFLGSRDACYTAAPAAIVDFRLANLGETQTQGLDLELRQVLKNSVGLWTFGIRGTEILHYDQAASPSVPLQDVLNTLGNPIAVRVRGTLDWARRGRQADWGAQVALNYTGGYRNPSSALVPRVPSWTTADMQLRWKTRDDGRWLGGTEIDLNVVNLFNESPPFVDWMQGYDWFAAQPLGRVTSVSVRKTW